MRGIGYLLVALHAVWGCGGEIPLPVVEPGAGSPPGLGSSFNVSVEADTVHLELHVTNVTDGPVTLEFNTTQRYDFAVARTDGETVWHWSAARQFGQALGTDTLAPGESRRYGASWAAGRRGDYVAVAWLTSSSHPVELRTVFRVVEQSAAPD